MVACLLCCVFMFFNHHHHVRCQHQSARQAVPTVIAGTSPGLASQYHVVENTGQFPVTTERTKTSTCELPGDTFGGDCLQHVFEKYGENGVMTLSGFEKLLRSIGLSESSSDEEHHDDDDDHHVEDDYEAARKQFEDALQRKSMSLSQKTGTNRESVDDVRIVDDASMLKDTHKLSTRSAHTNTEENDLQYSKLPGNSRIKRGDDFQMTYNDLSESKDESSSYSDGLDVLSEHEHGGEDDTHQCWMPKRYFDISSYHSNSNQDTIDQSAFIQICPILIQQLESQSCHKNDRDHSDEYANEDNFTDIPPHVWGYGILSITIISLVSLCGILIVPVFRRFPEGYKRLLAVLVALAVGTLSGDAILHLIPHSYGLHAHEESDGSEHSDHGDDNKAQEAVYRGLVVLLGIYFFFMVERLMHIYSDTKKKQKNSAHAKKQLHLKKHQVVVGSRLSNANNKTEYSESLPMVVTLPVNEKSPDQMNNITTMVSKTTDKHHHGNAEHSNNSVQDDPDHRNLGYQESQDHVNNDQAHLSHKHSQSLYGHHHDDVEDNNDHHHHHHHHHGANMNDGIASVAWMVIMGDGLHNFSDGLVVGAAFSDSITGGISTSVAIFCHELPHELGDFAILLSSGMAVKQAVMYSLLSSILSYIGMFIGIAISNIKTASLWVFALAGGMFLYIALVDMLPEMMHGEKKRQWLTLLLQNVGILLGIGIMLIIALFEEKLLVALQ